VRTGYRGPMITALILADGRLEALATTVSALVPAVAEGLVADAVVLSRDRDAEVERVAEAVGAAFLVTPPGEDPWAAGAAVARRHWVLCLGAGDLPSQGWMRAVDRFVALAPPDRRFGRLPRRHPTLLGRLLGAASLARSDAIRPGDVIHHSVLTQPRRPRPLTIGAFVERDPAFG
jgi:hypothetical protein